MILRRQKTPSRIQIGARLILSAMAVREFVCLCADTQGQQLGPKANAEDRLLLFNYFLQNGDCLFANDRITGPIGDKDPIELFIEIIVMIRNSLDFNWKFQKRAKSILFHSAVDGDDLLFAIAVFLGLLRTDGSYQMGLIGIGESMDFLFV